VSQFPLLAPAALAAALCCQAHAGPRLALCCSPDNDLLTVLSASGLDAARFDTPTEALEHAAEGSAILVLAEGYPERTTDVPEDLVERAVARNVRLYIEYPTALSGLGVGAPQGIQWERGVVSSGFFGEKLPAMRILAIHDCRFVPVEAQGPHIAVARVAGFDTAVYGLPADSHPILFNHPTAPALIATTKLSQFVTARYAPTEAWGTVWHGILSWLCRGEQLPALSWTPTVRPSYGRDETLPVDVESRAAQRGAEWFLRSGLLATGSAERELAAGVTLPPLAGPGDGTHGVLEGYSAGIKQDGTQHILGGKRSDCNGESAMALAFGGKLGVGEGASASAGNILDYWLEKTIAQKAVRADPQHPTYGLIAWGISSWALEKAYYGDDNARFLLGAIATGALVGTDRWDDGVLKCLLANLRTTGRYGFRNDRIDIENLEAGGWRAYFDGFTTSYAPHYQAYLWACYLWAYRATGYELFLRRAENAIRMTMAAYPDKWRWTNGIAQERARMLLPLAWLVRLQDTEEHREWLRLVAEDLLERQAPCGAIGEELGQPGMGAYGPPRSNEEYGTNEATLMQQNGDPVCDLLYTTNFAFIGLHEAAAATGDPFYRQAEDRLAGFLCRIQVRSEKHAELEGGWFRAFDYDAWDYWGSSADAGWGVWCIETGWTQGWITAVFGLRQMQTSFWDLTSGVRMQDRLEPLKQAMFPDGDEPSTQGLVSHLGMGRPITLNTAYSAAYPGGGDLALVDGRVGSTDFRDPAWQGYEGLDLDATIDLGEPRAIAELTSAYLQNVQWGIFLPTSVEYAVSDDGEAFRVVAEVRSEVDQRTEGPLRQEFKGQVRETARYVRVRAKGLCTIPEWHSAKGKGAWLFVDEVVVK